MIIANIIGGLGNQMFQYASAEAMGVATRQPVLYVTNLFAQQNTHNGFELERVFGLTLPLATATDLNKLIGRLRAQPYARRGLAKFNMPQWLIGRNFHKERGFIFDPNLSVKLASGGYMHGYWQSENYFNIISDRLSTAFSFRTIEHFNLPDPAEINVSLHVRRGDYLAANSLHASCDVEYYKRALAKLDLPTEKTAVYVFSDDPNWARVAISELHPNLRIIEGHKGVDSYKDMYLMSLCDHHIIANSSYSWWGAWLNLSPRKQVVAPKVWFTDRGLDDSHLVPNTWFRI